MKKLDYGADGKLFYPGSNLTEEEKNKLDHMGMGVAEMRPEYVIYVLSNLFTTWVHSALELIEKKEGYDKAKEIAEELGARHAYNGWTAFLKYKGVKHGTPKLMAEYQDIAHTYRGPVHTGALYAEYDDRKCVVKRKSCIYYGERRVGEGLYDGAMNDGFMRGYMEADSAIEKIDRGGLCFGDTACEHVWWFKNTEEHEGEE